MRELALEEVLPFPGGFLLCVVRPLDLVELDRALTGDSGGFFQDTKVLGNTLENKKKSVPT